MSYPISGLVKSYRAKDYDVDHKLVVRNSNILICNVSNTRECVSSNFQTPRSVLKKRAAAEFFFNQLRWKLNETLFRVEISVKFSVKS